MNQRIVPKHYWKKNSLGDGIHTFATYSYTQNEFWYFHTEQYDAVTDEDIAVFKIRPKTPQEKQQSIYYPKPTTK